MNNKWNGAKSDWSDLVYNVIIIEAQQQINCNFSLKKWKEDMHVIQSILTEQICLIC